jgi:hypothetical protein
MVTNRASAKGFVTEGPVDGSVTTVLENFVRKYELYQHLSSQTISGANVYHVLRFPGTYQTVSGGLNTWNTSSSTFFPQTLNQTYLFRIDFVMSASTGNPLLHLCFDRVGTVATDIGGGHVGPLSIHRQEVDSDVVRGGQGHSHFHWFLSLIADSTLMASGAQIYVSTLNQNITFSSGSILIKEG